MSETMQVGINQAARLTGKNKSVIWRDTKAGKLSSSLCGKGKTVYNLAELERVYGKLKDPNAETVAAPVAGNAMQLEMEREKMDMKLQFLERELSMVKDQLFELKDDRDQWRDQAQTALRALPGTVAKPAPETQITKGFWPFRRLGNA
jgi:hypothetical protein